MSHYYEGHVLLRPVDLELAEPIAKQYRFTPSEPLNENPVHLTSRDKDIQTVAYNGELLLADLKKINITPIRFIICQILKDESWS